MALRLLGRAADRPPCRRHRPGLPAPRERDRAERGRHEAEFSRFWFHVEHPVRRAREDVEVARQRLHAARHRGAGHRPSALRYLLLSSHYRKQLNFTGPAWIRQKSRFAGSSIAWRGSSRWTVTASILPRVGVYATRDQGDGLEVIHDDGVVCLERLLEDAVDCLVQRQRITMRGRLDELARREIHAPGPREQRPQDLRLAHARTSRQDGDVVFRQPLLERGQRGTLYPA